MGRLHRSDYSNSTYNVERTGRSQKAFAQPLINHIAFVLDGSSSMQSHAEAVIKVINGQVAYLARRSQELGQETRVSIYVFADGVECLVHDVDVLRLPSIVDLYDPYGNTALVHATMTALKELEQTSQLHGDHSFLVYVLSDGQENASFDDDGYRYLPSAVSVRIHDLPENWTVAGLVPDQLAKREAVGFGFPKDNLSIWDVDSATGMDEVNSVVTAATENYFAGRASGVRGSRSIFSTGPEALNKATVTAALSPLPMDKFSLIPVMPDGVQKGDKIRVDKFIREDCGMPFRLGSVYYEWSKKETVQPQKRLAVVQKSTGKVFVGTYDEVRELIGLPSLNIREAPKANPDFTVFVQSTASNRNLVPFTKVLVML